MGLTLAVSKILFTFFPLEKKRRQGVGHLLVQASSMVEYPF